MLGLNRPETALTVKDGACETLHNLRYDNGAWRNVNDFLKLRDVRDYGGFKVLFKHPATGDDLYVEQDTAGMIHEVRFTGGAFVSCQVIHNQAVELQTLFAFGTALVLVTPDAELYYVLYGSEYVAFNMPAPPAYTTERIDNYPFYPDCYYKYNPSDPVNPTFIDGRDNLANLPYIVGENESYWIIVADITAEQRLLADHYMQYWHGEIALMCAYRMKDGTTVANSELTIFVPEKSDEAAVSSAACIDELRIGHKPHNQDVQYLYIETKVRIGNEGTNNRWFVPNIGITIPDNLDGRLIDGVAVYSTRINPLWNVEQLWDKSGTWEDYDGDQRDVNFRRLYEKNNDLVKQPLYCIKEIPLSDFTDGRYALPISYNLLNGAETKPVFEPTQSLHAMTASCYYEYNSRLHKACLKTRFFPGYTGFCTFSQSPRYNSCLVTTVNSDGQRREILRRTEEAFPLSVGRIVSYPDYRAERFGILTETRHVKTEGPLSGIWQFDTALKPCEANNYAYAIRPSMDHVKYPAFDIGSGTVRREPVTPDDLLAETNRVQVSAIGNLFALPFANSYRVGNTDETILALASVADELSETRFGAFPLYIFTDRGVWSLESGSGEVLYSNIIPVNHDRIVNPSTCTALGTVFYITSRGVYGLSGRKSQLISGPLENELSELLEYLTGARLFFQFKYGDLIVYNEAHSFAYVYSVGSGVWSSRDMAGIVLNDNEIISSAQIHILDDEKAGEPVECLIVTRPVKFGSTEFKRVETVVARIDSRDSFAHLRIEGSNDSVRWFLLRDEWCNVRDMDMRLRRTSVSCKFFRFTLHLTANESLTVTGIDAEYYTRFIRKLR